MRQIYRFDAFVPPPLSEARLRRELERRKLRRQAALGADVVKAAVMVDDSVQALEAALVMARAQRQIEKPMIAIAMGPDGVLTRAACACVGSCLTFGTAGKASAPGQMDAKALRGVLEAVDCALHGG